MTYSYDRDYTLYTVAVKCSVCNFCQLRTTSSKTSIVKCEKCNHIFDAYENKITVKEFGEAIKNGNAPDRTVPEEFEHAKKETEALRIKEQEVK